MTGRPLVSVYSASYTCTVYVLYMYVGGVTRAIG